MSLRFSIAATPLIALSGPGFAQDTSTAIETLRIFAAASPACVLSSVSASDATNAVFTSDGNGGGSIAITQLVDPGTAEPLALGIDLTLPVVCNSAHRLVVSSAEGGLLRAGGRASNRGVGSGFADFLPYSLALDWGTMSMSHTSSLSSPLASTQGARSGELRLRVTSAQGGGPLTAGRYADTIIIRFEPAS